jgi:hypothetical protein
MTEEATQEIESTDSGALSMSDEDLLKMSPQEFIAAQQQKSESEEDEPEEEKVEESEPEPESEPESEQEEEEYEEDEEEAPVREQPIYEAAEDEDEPEEVKASGSMPKPKNGVDYEAEYQKLLSPFRASKREIQVKSVDDARKLMQMGVDYQYKMQAIKPQLRIMRALDKNGLLDEDKINFFIDLDKKNPEAIKEFLREKQIDPMELDLDSESQYKPGSYAPTEQEQAIDDVLDDIRGTKSFDRTIDEIGTKWDSGSREILTKQPQLIKLINDQVETGIYDQIMNVVASERMLGRLEGLNDLLAYKTVGDALQASGAFDHLKKESKPKRKTSQDPKLKARKRAASPTRRSSSTQPSAKDFNPLALSDDEFEKMGAPSFR